MPDNGDIGIRVRVAAPRPAVPGSPMKHVDYPLVVFVILVFLYCRGAYLMG